MLRAVAESVDWQVGAMWMVDKTASKLRCLDLWCAADVSAEAFERETRNRLFDRGVGPAGRGRPRGRPGSWTSRPKNVFPAGNRRPPPASTPPSASPCSRRRSDRRRRVLHVGGARTGRLHPADVRGARAGSSARSSDEAARRSRSRISSRCRRISSASPASTGTSSA